MYSIRFSDDKAAWLLPWLLTHLLVTPHTPGAYTGLFKGVSANIVTLNDAHSRQFQREAISSRYIKLL